MTPTDPIPPTAGAAVQAEIAAERVDCPDCGGVGECLDCWDDDSEESPGCDWCVHTGSCLMCGGEGWVHKGIAASDRPAERETEGRRDV